MLGHVWTGFWKGFRFPILGIFVMGYVAIDYHLMVIDYRLKNEVFFLVFRVGNRLPRISIRLPQADREFFKVKKRL